MVFGLKINIKSLKFQVFIALIITLFFFKLFFTPIDSFFLKIINEIIVISAIISFIVYLIELMRSKKINPLSMVMNVGIISAFLFFLFTFSEAILNGLFDNLKETISRPGMVYPIVSFIYVFLIFVSISYIFLTFKELFFLKQNKNLNTYFVTMLVFFFLTSAAALLENFESLSFIRTTFFVLSILLIVMNSIKISWIAFIVKKEKIY
ncbi:MAG: hypothetical protein ABI550_00715, partial [Ignavibacteriaceae bacterium]